LAEDAIFLLCPPVRRGQEVTAEAMEHPLCQSRAAKAFLLHAQNARMEWVTVWPAPLLLPARSGIVAA